MRFFLGLLFLFASISLPAQCIEVTIAGVDCVIGDGVRISFDVEGQGDSVWALRGFNMTGSYDTDEIFTLGPIQPEADTLLLEFFDLADSTCRATVPVVLDPNCRNTDPCFGVGPGLIVQSGAQCDSLANGVSLRATLGPFPIAVELTREGVLLRSDSIIGFNPVTYNDLPPGNYVATGVNDLGCTSTVAFSVFPPDECHSISGRSWLDTNRDGIRQPNETPVRTLVVVFRDGEAILEEVTDRNGNYLIDGLTSGTYQLQFDPANSLLPTIYQAGDDPTVDSDVRTNSYRTEALVLSNAENLTDIDAGWIEGSCSNTVINWFAPFFLPCDGGSVTISTGDSTDFIDYYWLTPGQDTLFGPSIEATESGSYRVFGQIPGDSCLITGVATVIGAEPLTNLTITAESLDSLEQGTGCGNVTCFYLDGIPRNQLSRYEVRWFGPDGAPLDAPFGFSVICVSDPGVYTVEVAGPCDTVRRSAIIGTEPECGALNGTVYVDQAGNCALDTGEDTPASGVMVRIEHVTSGAVYHAITNADGKYGIDLPLGTYTVTPITTADQPFGACEPPLSVEVGSVAANGADLFLPALLDCPQMTTGVSLPFLRRCFENFAYVDYKNVGSAVAEGATLTVTLDDLFTEVVPSVDPVSIEGNTYVFALGDVNPFAQGQIFFRFKVSCAAALGQSHCLESSVTPNDPCNPSDNWNGALVNISSPVCEGDSVSFSISNRGSNPMTVPLNFIVVEDGIMMNTVPFERDGLEAGGSIAVKLPANGKTYQVITNQEPHAPGSTEPTAYSEGCGTAPNGTFTTGLANLLTLGNGIPSEAVACRANVGAYDPNDKRGYPEGYGGGNIAAGTRLEFAIRFQNTGTDTAFNVVIRDHITEEFDLKTFRVESASHDYSVSIDSHRTVTFTFADIMLPDSNVNLAASQGVVNYSIDHDPNLNRGDQLTNQAAIYFDFNEPIITNTTKHRIAKSGLPTGTRQQGARAVSMRAYPNPTAGPLRVDSPASEAQPGDLLTVTDIYGRALLWTPYRRAARGLDVSALPAGYYYLILTDEGGIAKGRTGFVRR